MKRFYIIAILITICGITAMAQDRPDLTHQTNSDDRDRMWLTNDMPSLVFDETAQVILVEGSESDYYIATITSQANQMVMLETVIDGEYDIIDVSMLTAGNYTIALTSSNWNTYTWTFNQALGVTSNRTAGRTSGRLTNAANGGFMNRE